MYNSILCVYNYVLFPRPMPDEPLAAAEWLMPKVLKVLSDAKLLPLKIGHLKHQGALCNLTLFSQNHLMPQYIYSFLMIHGNKFLRHSACQSCT